MAAQTFRIFVSSTFSDLKAERNALQERVFPRLRELAAQHGSRFQAIDLRWGVSDQASLDQQAMNICLGEIARCQQTSPRPNFIVLLGDRYGWCPPPSQIPEDEFNHIRVHIQDKQDPEDLALLQAWYELDRNAIPPEYRLKPRRRGGDYENYEAWEPVEARLQAILARAVTDLKFDPSQRLPFTASATEQEIAAGALQVPEAGEHVFCFFREVEGLPDRFDARDFLAEVETRLNEEYPDGLPDPRLSGHIQALNHLDPASSAKDFHLHFKTLLEEAPKASPERDFLSQVRGWLVDFTGRDFQNLGGEDWLPDQAALTSQNRLKQRLADHVPGNECHYQARWTGRSITTGHIDQLCQDVYQTLAGIILAEIENPHLAAVTRKKDHIQPDQALDAEGLAHHAFAEERLQFFVGRTKILNTIADYLKNPEGCTLAISGAGGTGKSALTARAILQAKASHPKAEIVTRFIGATPGSSDGRNLLDSLCREISRRYGASEADVPLDFRELVPEFGVRLALATDTRPLIMFLDSLDQLSVQQEARALTWLPGQLPANVRLVVTTRPEDTLEKVKAKQHQLQVLEGLSDQEGDQLLSEWLADANHTLQANQRVEVLDKFVQSKGAPLYLKLAFEEARQWVSGDGNPPESLQPGIQGIIAYNLIDRLADEGNHGRVLVAKVLGYLAASRYGLAEDEIIDLLSRDLEVYRWFLESSYHLPADLVKWAALYRAGQASLDRAEAQEPDGDQIRAATEWLQEIRNPPDELLVFLAAVLPKPKGPRLPVVLWSRLSFDLDPYLSERLSEGSTLLTFYHRELGDVSRSVFLADGKDLSFHENLADYFNNRTDPKADGSWTGDYPRGLSELPYHLTQAKRWDEIFNTLTDFRFLEEKAAQVGVMESQDERGELVKSYTGVFQLQEDYERALAAMPGGDGAGAVGSPLILTAQDRCGELTIYCPVCNQTASIDKKQLDKVITCPQQNCNRRLKINPFVTKMA